MYYMLVLFIYFQLFLLSTVHAIDQGQKIFLVEATVERDLDVVRWLVNHEANINVKDENGLTPLMHASTLDNSNEVIQILLENGADTEVRDLEGKTALHLAVEVGNKNAVELLLPRMTNNSITDKNGRTALHIAVNSDYDDLLPYLINQGIDCNAKDIFGFTAVHTAAMIGRTGILKLFESMKIDLDSESSNNATPLILASFFEQSDTAEFLIELGANINSQDNNNWTPLQSAAYTGNLKLVKLLVEKGAKLDIENLDGQTALYLAVNNGHFSTVEYLISKGSNISIIDSLKNTIIHGAAASGNVKLIEYLSQRFKELDEYNELGYTPLIVAAINGNEDATKYLLSAGADIGIVKRLGIEFLQKAVSTNNSNLLDILKQIDNTFTFNKRYSKGETLLHYASSNSNAAIVKYLIDRMTEEQIKNMESTIQANKTLLMGPELCLPSYINITNIKDLEGKTSLYYAAEGGNSDVVDILVKHGSDQSYADNNGLTAFHIAAKLGHTEILKKLAAINLNINLVDKTGCTAVFLSAKEGRLDSLKYLINLGADVTIKDATGWSLLHAATANGHMTIVQELLRHKIFIVEINNTDKDNKPPTWYAINNGYIDILNILELNGAKIHQDHLCEAIQRDNVEFAKYLLRKDGKKIVKDCFNQRTTLLHIAASRGYLNLTKQLTKYSCLVNSLDKENKSPLWFAVKEQKWDCVSELEREGGEIKPYVTSQEAIQNNLISFVKYFVKKGISFNKNALHIAASKGYTDVVQELAHYPSLINSYDNDNKTPLWYAIRGEHWDCVNVIEGKGGFVKPHYSLEEAANNNLLSYVKYLLRKGHNVHSTARDGIPIVYWAAIHGYNDIVEYFLDSGANIEALNPNTKNSMVIIASYYGQCHTVRLLLQRGAFVNRINKSGHTALDVTKPACRGFLLQYGARTSRSLRG